MSRTERCLVREFKSRMCALEPGDALAALSSSVPPEYRILVLDRTAEGALTFSLPCGHLRIVADPRGPFRWHEETETLVDSDENPHELIDLGTQVEKGIGLELVSEFHELSRWAKTFSVLEEDRISEIMAMDSALHRKVDAALFNDWLTTPNARVAAALELIIGRPLTESEQAHSLALVSCLARAVPVVDLVIVPGGASAETPPRATH